jgi:hypothetical protein
MPWKVASLLGEVAITAWAFLLAYRVIGKRPGEDPGFDQYMSFMSGSFKVIGVIGVITIALSLIGLVALPR